jgi:hypothetical protein
MKKTIFLNNLIKNSGFKTDINWDLSGNSSYVTTDKVSGSRCLKLPAGSTTPMGIQSLSPPILNHKYYSSVMLKSDGNTGGNDGRSEFYGGDGLGKNWVFQSTLNFNNSSWTKVSSLHSIDVINASNFMWRLFIVNPTANLFVDNLILVDLTAAFGLGKEPTKEWCDANIPYFENEYSIQVEISSTSITTVKDFVDIYNSKYIELVKAPVIKPKFKIELLDLYENTIGEITKDISASNSGSISINYQQGVRRSCSFTLSDTFGKYRPMSNDNIFGFNTKFKIYVGLENIQTGETYWFSQGIFYTTNPTSSHANSNKTVTVNGVDKFGIFTSDTGYNQLEGTYIVPAKSKLYAVVKDILSLELGNGYIIDPKEPHIDAEFINYELPYDIKKSPGSYMGDILIELGNVLGADIFYDTNGILNITSGTTDITYSKQSSIWDFSDVLPEYSNGSVSLNTIDAINIVKVVGNQVNDSEIYIGNAENHNPLSPTAIEKIGRKIYYEESANLPNQARADEYAKYVLNSKSIIQTAIGFSSTLIPHLDVNRVITITDDYYKYEQERFIIQSITMPLDSKTLMSISCNNIASLPYYDLRNGG